MWRITTNGRTTLLDQADPDRYIRHTNGAETFIVLPGDKTTGTSSSPRTEKRELPGNWKLADAQAHVLFGRFIVEQMPASGKLIVGQIHAKNAAAPAVKVLTLRGKLRCEVRKAPGDSSSPSVLEVPLLDGENWYAAGVDQDGGGIVYLNGQSAYFEIEAWSKHLCYFKQGAYSIDKDSPARVRFQVGGYQHGPTSALTDALEMTLPPEPAAGLDRDDMVVWDRYACAALQGVLAEGTFKGQTVVEYVTQYADAMMRARAERRASRDA